MLDMEQVLKFLRKNGLSNVELALMEDVIEKQSELGSSDFETFKFPMVPPLRPQAHHCTSDSQDHFLSFDSPTTQFCSPEFNNPHGVRSTTRSSSGASSDRMSQLGTARDYPDFDMQSDGPDPSDNDPREDKFIMPVKTGKHGEYQVNSNRAAGGSQSQEDADDFEYQLPKEDIFAKGFHMDQVFQHDGSISDIDDCLSNDNYSCEDYTRWVRNTLESDSEACKKGKATTDDLPVCDINENDNEIFHLKIIHRKNRTGFEKKKDLLIIPNRVFAGRYYVVEYLGSAAFSEVVKARDLHTGMDVCIKIVKNDKDSFDRNLDEIKILKFVNKNDPANKCHIIRPYDYFYHKERMFIVTELLHSNLYELQKFNRESGAEHYFTLSRLQVIAMQCLEALEFLHSLGITHCDLKPENILISSYQRCEIKVIDLGSSCFKGDEMSLYVQSRPYRAPEVILGLPYDQKIDLWSLGSILSELYSGEVLFPNEAIVLILARVIGMFGAIDMEMLVRGKETHKYYTRDYDLYDMDEETNEFEFIMPEEFSLEHHLQISDPVFISFVKYLLQVNPERRPTATEALQHPWLRHSY